MAASHRIGSSDSTAGRSPWRRSMVWFLLARPYGATSFLFYDAAPSGLLAAAPLACEHNCTGHGICMVATGACACFAGWAGTSCEEEVVEESCQTSCSGHGWCHKTTCLCEEYWYGPHCERPSACANGCSGFGECVDHKWCRCDADHTGLDCSRPTVRCPGWPRSCGGLTHGTCADTGECVCRPAWRGTACEESTAVIPCKSNCSGHGLCDPQGSGHCLCDPEWEGLACQRPLGTLSPGAILLRILIGLVVTSGAGMAGVLAWCMRVRGVTPRDVLRGQWHIRKEEGWRRGEAEGQLPGARFERFGEWGPTKSGAAGAGASKASKATAV